MAQEFDFSVVDVELENSSIDKLKVGCFISIDGQEIDCIGFDNVDHRLVLGLEPDGAVIRVVTQTLDNKTKFGSVSFTSDLLHEFAKRNTQQVWATLFDHEDDDLYDGDFQIDDTEKPKILVSLTRGAEPTIRKEGAFKSTTTRVSPKKVEIPSAVETAVFQESEDVYTIEYLITELRTITTEIIATLNEDTSEIQDENNDRLEILANLEKLQQELHLQNIEDKRFTDLLTSIKEQIENDLGSKKKEIEDEIQALLSKITTVIEETKKAQADKGEAEKLNTELKEKVEAPEDTTEKGLTQESTDLREENSKLQGQSDQLTAEFTQLRDERNGFIQEHSDLVETFEDDIQKYHDQLRSIVGDKRVITNEHDRLLREQDLLSKQQDYYDRKLGLTEFDQKSLKRVLQRLSEEYKDSDEEFQRYLQELRKNIRNQDFIISDLYKKLDQRENQVSDIENEKERHQSQVDHLNSELQKIEKIEYEQNYTKLSGNFKKAEDVRKNHQVELENAQAGLASKLELFADDLEGHKAARKAQEQKLQDALSNLEAVTGEINKILKDIELLNSKEFTDATKDQILHSLTTEQESLDNKLQFYLDEKSKLVKEVKEAIKDLEQRQTRVKEQEQIIRGLKKEIREVRTTIEEKRKIIVQLEAEIRISDDKIDELQGELKNRDQEIEELMRDLARKESRIKKLEGRIGTITLPSPPKPAYKAKRGDEVDELLAQYIQDCPVPVKRLGGGFYLFGTRKIYAKIMNGKLVIRVGGGYMVIQKFIETYADQELTKLESILEKEGLTDIDEIDLEEYCLGKGKTSYGNVPGQKSPSASNTTHTASFRKSMTTASSKINGTTRSQKKFTTTKVVFQNK